MTSNERIEKTLNRAGQTASDLPKSYGWYLTYDKELRSNAEHQVFEFAGQSGFVDIIDCLAIHQDYIIHQAEVIDRLETALENVCNERDYLAYRLRRYRDCQSCGRAETCDRTPDRCLGWVFGGVPDGSVDDE